MKKVLISACLLGHPCRYDGKSRPFLALASLRQLACLKPFCPEEAGGLSTPRPPCEIKDGKARTQQGKDCTDYFLKGAALAVHYCQQEHITLALLKENSPSCGVNYRYDGNFCGKKIAASGLTTQALEKIGVRVFSEAQYHKLKELL